MSSSVHCIVLVNVVSTEHFSTWWIVYGIIKCEHFPKPHDHGDDFMAFPLRTFYEALNEEQLKYIWRRDTHWRRTILYMHLSNNFILFQHLNVSHNTELLTFIISIGKSKNTIFFCKWFRIILSFVQTFVYSFFVNMYSVL